jgi:hypothetical protein
MQSDLAPFRRLGLAFAALALAACGLMPAPASATPLLPSPTSVDFLQAAVGTASGPQTVVVSNPTAGSGQVASVEIAGPDASEFEIGGESCAGATLGQGESCLVEVSFAPQSSGAKSAMLEIALEGEPTILVPLTGTGLVKHLTVPAAASFPVETLGVKTTEQVPLKNEGEVGLTIGEVKIEGADSGDFGIEGGNCSGQLEPTQGCTLTVSFTPTAAGSREAVLKVLSDAVPGESLVELSGEGATPELSFEPSSYDFGLLEVHAGGRQESFTLRNTGATAVQLGNLEIAGPDADEFWIPNSNCWGTTLAAGATCSVQVQFNANEEGGFAAAVRVSVGSFSFEAPLSARAKRPQVTPSSEPLEFGQTTVGGSQTRELTLTNVGNLPVGFFIAIVSGGDVSSFHMVEESCTSNLFAGHPHLVEPGESCVAKIRFEPTSPGAKAATVSFFGSGEGALQVEVEGSGAAPQVSLSPGSRDFGAVAVGTPGPVQVFELRNESADPYAVGAVSLAGVDLGEFAIRSDGCSETVLAPGDGCAVAVRFDPESARTSSATLRLRGNAGTTVARLSGDGTASPGTVTENVAAVVRGRVALRFNSHLHPGVGGRVTIGRARCESRLSCVVTLGGRSGARALPAARIRLQPGASAPLVVVLPARPRSGSPAPGLAVALRWQTGPDRGSTNRSFEIASP